ncbi:MAG: hypothetical protein UY35_C0023G0006 [Candidatus Saccharibacteria bacterium GW2011_GWC2_48_9]|nr:MAG: hypothetical protein UY35_C0023G0006 [Candidatus Saccharibacteria bacterium GW2011_GWC2_48_9]HCH34628.1 hypothetical protein [Candidatus Saccharibacteria bacterium]
MRYGKNGFTIVELLIVIVVIGILAAITIVAFNGVQERARNTQTIGAVKDLKSIYMAYAIQNGSYPGTGNYCIGTGYQSNLCWDNRAYTTDTTANSQILQQAKSIPQPSTTRVYRNSVDGSRAGVLYVNNFSFRYQLEGASTECGLPGATRTFSAGQSTGPECSLVLPDPATL